MNALEKRNNVVGTVAYYFVNDLLFCTREPTLFERLTSFSCWVYLLS